MSDAEKKQSEQEKAIEYLREILRPGDVVSTILRHVSRSGMLRSISPVMVKDGKAVDLTYWVASAIGWKVHRNHYGIKVQGCGMDMGFHLVYSLSYALYGSGYECIQDNEKKTDCPSNYHVNSQDWTRQETPHKDGYALKQKWL